MDEHIPVLAAILSDISDDSDTNVIHVLLASEFQQQNKEEHFKTNKTPNEISCLQTLLGHVIKAVGIVVFFWYQKTRALSREESKVNVD